MNLKRCNSCEEHKPATLKHFYAHKTSKDKLSYDCRPCYRAHKKWRDQNLKRNRTARKLCPKCGTLPHRVQGRVCSVCGTQAGPPPPLVPCCIMGSNAAIAVNEGELYGHQAW